MTVFGYLSLVELKYDNQFLVRVFAWYANSPDNKREYFSIALHDVVSFWILMLVFSPLFFVPFFNVGLQILFWAWLVKDSYFLSAATLHATDEKTEALKEHNVTLWSIALIASILNLIPVVNILAPFFTQIIFFHWVMLNRPKMTEKNKKKRPSY